MKEEVPRYSDARLLELEVKSVQLKEERRRGKKTFLSLLWNGPEEKNFQDPDIGNKKVTRILRLLVMLMGPNLKWNIIHIFKIQQWDFIQM